MAFMISANGNTGTVSFDGRMVTITRSKGEKRIPLRSLSAVQWKEPTSWVNGFIQFTLAGGVERNVQKGSRTMSAVSDENSVVFTTKQRDDMHQVKVEIEDALAGPEPMPVQAAPAGPPAGWYPDQQRPGNVMYWDGVRWVMETSRPG